MRYQGRCSPSVEITCYKACQFYAGNGIYAPYNPREYLCPNILDVGQWPVAKRREWRAGHGARAGRDARQRVPGAGTVPSASEFLFRLCQSPYLVRLRRFFALDVDCSHLLFTVDVQVSIPPYMFLFLSINNVIYSFLVIQLSQCVNNKCVLMTSLLQNRLAFSESI